MTTSGYTFAELDFYAAKMIVAVERKIRMKALPMKMYEFRYVLSVIKEYLNAKKNGISFSQYIGELLTLDQLLELKF